MSQGTTGAVEGEVGEPGPARSSRRRWWALVVVCLGMFMVTLDSSIVNVALPKIQHDLHFTQSGLTWVVDAFLITFGSFLLLAGRLGDLIGRKKVFLGGVALFTASSAVCGAASSQGMLIAGRFTQGLGGAFSASVIIAIIFTEFPDPAERRTAMSAYVFVAVGGGAVGLLAGGILTQLLNWHWIFFVNLPIGVATFIFGRALIDENVGLGVRNGVDVAGSVLVTAALMVGVYAIIEATQYGWLSAHTFGFGGVAVVLAVAFLILQDKLKNPIMPLRILTIGTLVRSSVVRSLLTVGTFTTLFLASLYFEDVRGYTPLRTGLAFLPASVVIGVMSAGVTSRLIARFGNRRVLVPGTVCFAVGLFLMARIEVDSNYVTVVLPGLVLIAMGVGLAQVPLLAMAMSEVPPADAGLGSGVVNVSMQVSSALGLAVLSTVATSRTRSLEAVGTPLKHALVGGYRLSFFLGGACCSLGVLLSVVWLRERGTDPDAEAVRAATIEGASEPLAT